MKTIKLEDKVIYQIFPRSFYDSNNDGDGDLKGITLKLDYLKDLGINAIWLCPIYKTNFVDAGYDVLDYKSVWSQFGTLEDFCELTKEAKKRNIDIIMDIVLNHVSNEHEWFKKACESVHNIEHNYFIWRDKLSATEQEAKSIFGGDAWEYVPSVNRYYFHLFAKEQVDLNWEHPDTIKAISDVIQFWYDLGVRGFRLDAIKHVAKDFNTVKENPAFAWCNGAVDYLKKFNELAFKDKPDAYVLGESSGISYDELIRYGDGKEKVADNYFNFSWWWIGWGRETGRNGYDANWNYHEFVRQQKPFQQSNNVKPHMITNFLSNHDTSRSISRWGHETFFREQSAKTHALFLMMLKGIPCIYYGEEIGMLNTEFNSRDEFRDVDTYNAFAGFVDQEKIYSESEMLLYSNINSRDAGRVIMQWNDSVNYGFNSGNKTWIKLGRFGSQINVENDIANPNSIWNFYKKLIKMRKQDYHDLIVYGESKIELQDNGSILLVRKDKETNQEINVLINMTNRQIKLSNSVKGEQILSTYNDNKKVIDTLRPYESILLVKEK